MERRSFARIEHPEPSSAPDLKTVLGDITDPAEQQFIFTQLSEDLGINRSLLVNLFVINGLDQHLKAQVIPWLQGYLAARNHHTEK